MESLDFFSSKSKKTTISIDFFHFFVYNKMLSINLFYFVYIFIL